MFKINNSYEYLKIKSDLRFSIHKAFKENNITIPFPQRDVHLIKQKNNMSKILIIEDEAAIRRVLSKIISRLIKIKLAFG